MLPQRCSSVRSLCYPLGVTLLLLAPLALAAPEVSVGAGYARATYIEAFGQERGSPRDRRYLDVHEGHMLYLKPGEEDFVPTHLLPTLSLVGSPDVVWERVQQYAEAGVDELAVQVVPDSAPDLIEEFSKHVIAKL